MSDQNPIDAFLGVGPSTQLQPQPESSNPIDAFMQRGVRATDLARTQVSGLERFGEGVGRGLIYPVRALVSDKVVPRTAVGQVIQNLAQPDEEAGIAGLGGELVGMGLSFIPFFRGATTLAAGTGLLAAAPRLARVVSGAVSFGAYESLAGATIEEAPERFAWGLVEGAVFEAGFMGLASAFRKKAPNFIEEFQKQSQQLETTAAEVAIHPDALKIERWFAPADETLEMTIQKLRAVNDPEANLYQALARISKTNMPGGSLILPDMGDIQGIQKLSKELNLRMAVHLDASDVKKTRFNVLLVDEEKGLLNIKDPELRKKFLGQGLPTLTVDEAIKLIDERGLLDAQIAQSVPGSAGHFSPYSRQKVGEREIRVTPTGDKYDMFSTVVHEYMHFLHDVAGFAKGGTSSPFTAIFERFGAGARGEKLPEFLSAGIRAGREQIVKDELVEATLEILQRVYRTNRTGALERYNRGIGRSLGGTDYYKKDTELLARMAELMFLDPKKAREIAPRATRMLASFIVRESPKMKELLSKRASVIDDVLKEFWVKRGDGTLTVWQAGKPKVTERDLRQFGKTGFFESMSAFYDGKQVAWLGDAGKGKSLIRFAGTGVRETVETAKLMRPVVPDVLRAEQKIIEGIKGMLKEQPKWVALTLRDFSVDVKEHPQGVLRRVVADLTDFEHVSNFRRWIKELPDELRQKYLNRVMQPGAIGSSPRNTWAARWSDDEVFALRQIISARGKKGLALYDNGELQIIVHDREALTIGNEASMRFANLFGGKEQIVGMTTESAFRVDFDDTLRSMLREKGVLEEDLDYFMQRSKEVLGEELRQIMSPEVRAVAERVEAATAKNVDNSVESLTARAGLEMQEIDGAIELRDASSKAVIARGLTEDEAIEYSVRAGLGVGDDVVPSAIPGSMSAGGNAAPPSFQGQLSQTTADIPLRGGKRFGEKLTDAGSLFLSTFSALENFAKTAERHGLGPVYERIFMPAQRAIFRVEQQLADVKRSLLGELTFAQGFQQLEKLVSKIPKNRHKTVTQYVEFLTKEEIAKAGGLLQRDLTANEIRVAEFIEKSGLQNDVPRLMSTGKLIESALKSQSRLDALITRMRRIELSPEAQQLLAQFESMPRFQTRDEVVQFLKLSPDELQVMKIIEDSKLADKDKFSIFAVSRYASAPRLKKGFKTGRDQFAAEHRLTATEIDAAKQIDKMMAAAFNTAGLDAKRQIGGYWPHMRVWAREGWDPKLLGIEAGLPKEFIDWSHDRFRTGELDVYNLDPLVTTFKYVRSMLMKQEFDPIMPDVRKALEITRDKDRRTFELMSEYIEELRGRPHESFGKLQRAMEHGLETLTGKTPPQGLVQDVINTLAALAASATIPFRPALIIRNYFESMQKIAPRVGIDHYFNALRYVTSGATRKEAFDSARKAFAITPGIQSIKSIHASSEVFGPGGAKLNYHLQSMLDKGFSWYQSADDWGRAIAFHAQKFRFHEAYGKFMKGQLDYEGFVEASKMLTFDPADIRIAERMIQSGNIEEAATHLGYTLSRETMNRYGHANHPAGWNSVIGRLFGQFGTWPVQYKDFLMSGLSRGTTKDRAEFAATHFGVMGATLVGGQAVGLNLMSWIGFPSLFYTGGPMAEMTIDVVRSISGSDTEKALARRNLVAQVPILGWAETGSPRSIFLPGSYLLGDLVDAAQADDLFEATLTGTGFRVLRPDQKTALEWLEGI